MENYIQNRIEQISNRSQFKIERIEELTNQ